MPHISSAAELQRTEAVPLASICPPIILIPTCNIAITHYRGDSLALVIHVWNNDAHTDPADLSTANVDAQLKVNATDPDFVDEFGVSIAGNAITLTLTPAQTRALPVKTVWDVQVDWFSDDTTVTTIATGTLTENQDVTGFSD